VAAKKMLDDKGLSYKEINIEEEGISRDDLVKLTGGFTVPQILIDNVPIGGFDKLLLLDQTGKLKELLGHS
jgi:glutaredoxin